MIKFNMKFVFNKKSYQLVISSQRKEKQCELLNRRKYFSEGIVFLDLLLELYWLRKQTNNQLQERFIKKLT